MRQKLVSAARCAIKMRSKETNTRCAMKKLEQDLINGPRHCFGHHDHCSKDFCSTVRERQQQPTSSSGSPGYVPGDTAAENTDISDILGKLCEPIQKS